MNLENQRVLLIDGLNLFLRNYIVVPQLSKDGYPIGGTIGFLKSLQKEIREIQPTVVIVCWDGKGGSTRRKQMSSSYKEGRSPIRLNRSVRQMTEEEEKENKIWQTQRTLEYLNSMPVIQLLVDGVEADDIIAYITKYSKYKESQKAIVSSDKDFFQLLDNKTILHRPVQKVYENKKTLIQEYKIHPNNFALARALDGDKSDKLPGVRGIGLKTIAKQFPFFISSEEILLEQFKEYCLKHKDTKKICQTILDNYAIVENNYHLMQLYSPLLSIQAKQIIDHNLDNFEFHFNKLEVQKMLLEDGAESIDWSSLFTHMKKIQTINK